MTANDSTPGRGQEGTGTESDWEAVGRELLADRLRADADAVSAVMHGAASSVGDGDAVTGSDVEEMLEALRVAYWTVEAAAEAAEGVGELPAFQTPPECADAHDGVQDGS